MVLPTPTEIQDLIQNIVSIAFAFGGSAIAVGGTLGFAVGYYTRIFTSVASID